MDVCGPLSLGEAGYLGKFVDDHTRYSEVRFLKKKSDVGAEAKAVFRKLENQTGLRSKKVKSANGGKYVSNCKELEAFCAADGTIHQRTPPYKPQRNGVAERLNSALLEKERAVQIAANLAKSTWGGSLAMANYLWNISSASGQERTPWELFYGKKVSWKEARCVTPADVWEQGVCAALCMCMHGGLHASTEDCQQTGFQSGKRLLHGSWDGWCALPA
jgi:hypothetical protein